jgi:hypothetical protein
VLTRSAKSSLCDQFTQSPMTRSRKIQGGQGMAVVVSSPYLGRTYGKGNCWRAPFGEYGGSKSCYCRLDSFFSQCITPSVRGKSPKFGNSDGEAAKELPRQVTGRVGIRESIGLGNLSRSGLSLIFELDMLLVLVLACKCASAIWWVPERPGQGIAPMRG